MRAEILVVDDDPNVRDLAALHLRNAGHSVRTAKDGVEAGYAVLAAPPDLILCDIQMPFMTGPELVAALRADSTIPRMPVLFLSSMDDGTDYAHLGVVEQLLKPVRLDWLLAAVAKHLRRAFAAP